jgi:hypothetical protein
VLGAGEHRQRLVDGGVDLVELPQTETAELLAKVVLRPPAWYAAVDEVKRHLARAAGDAEATPRLFRRAAAGSRDSGQPLDEIAGVTGRASGRRPERVGTAPATVSKSSRAPANAALAAA